MRLRRYVKTVFRYSTCEWEMFDMRGFVYSDCRAPRARTSLHRLYLLLSSSRPHTRQVNMTGPRSLRSHVMSLTGNVEENVNKDTNFSKKVHLLLLALFTLTTLYIVFFLYFWFVVWNRYDDLNWKLYLRLNTWIRWYNIFFILTCVAFTYFALFMCLFLYVVLQGRQPFIHPLHVLVSVCTLAGCVTLSAVVETIWSSEWTTTLLSLKMTGPFLQLGCVVGLTVCSWSIVSLIFQTPSTAVKLFSMFLFLGVILFLYTVPLYIDSPCVSKQLPPRPRLLAHRGASEILPENTLLAYRTALESGAWGVESDVQISSDCVPFIMHDRSLARTTNVGRVFPDRQDADPSSFSIQELKMLNAGKWFIDDDPRGTARFLTVAQREEVTTQTIPTLEELSLLVANYSNRYFMFDLYGPAPSHPCYNRTVDVTIEAINRAGFPLERVLWLESTLQGSRPPGVSLVGEYYLPLPALDLSNISFTNVQYIELTDDNIREYQSANVSINIWVINSEWFYSLYWCMGIDSVTTDRSPHLSALSSPTWHMTPNSYLGFWVTLDVLSAAVIGTVLLIQRRRLSRNYFV